MIFNLTKRKGRGGDTNPVADDNDVIYIDFDGTIRYSYSASDFAQLTEHPANPDHTDMGLVADGWNWTLANAKTYVAKYRWLVIGQTYHTASGHTEIDIDLRYPRMSPTVGLFVKGTVYIEWGDNSTDTTLTGTSISSSVITASHDYAEAGKYTIRIKRASSSDGYRIVGNATKGSYLICKSTDATVEENKVYHNSVMAIRVGTLASAQSDRIFANYAFKYLNHEYITVPEGVTFYGGNGAHFCLGCSRLKSIVAPKTYTYILGSGSDDGYLELISLSDSITQSNIGYAFRSFTNLRRLSLPNSVTSFGTAGVNACNSLSVLTIPENVTEITAQFTNWGLKEIHVTPTTPPTLGVNLNSNIPSDCMVYVPYSADHSVLQAYRNETNWATVGTDRLVEEPQ